MPTVTTYPGVFGPYTPITFTRASTATYFDSTGTLQTALDNVPRLDYDPSTLAAQGFLVEEARTNGIRNNTMQGAVAGTPGTLPTNWTTFTSLTGLTREVVGTGTENGINYIDIRLSGTPSAAGTYFINYEAANQVVASSGQAWTSSAYYKLQSGSLTGVSVLSNATSARNAAGAEISGTLTTFVPTASALNTQRITTILASNPALTAYELQFLRLDLSGVAIDITLRIGLPQLEQGAFATSVIPTTTTALTRSADAASVNTLSPWYNNAAGTVFSEWSILGVRATNNQRVWSLSDGTLSQYIAVRIDSAAQIRGEQTGGSTVPTTVLAVASANTVYKTGVTFQAGDSAICLGGGTVYSNTTFAYPAGINKLTLGNLATGSYELSGHLRRITYYPRRLSNAELQAITA